MSVDALKIFIYGLPPDCEASTLKDFLEAVCDCPGAVTKVSIPYKKTFAFITLSCPEIAKCFLGNTLLFCNDAGELYQVKARPYVKQQFQRKKVQEYIPKVKPKTTSMPKIEPKPVKYTSPDFVQQFTPDYSMLSLSKPKRKKRKKDDLTVWFGGVGSTSFRRKARRKKQRKQASKLELLKSESFQFGVISESKCTISMVEDGTEAGEVVDKVVHGNGQELNEAEERAPPVEFVLIEHLNGAKSSCSISSHTQVIIDHDYLGPLCLQFTSPPTVADVKNELLMRTGLPVKDQLLYCNGKKLCDNLNLRCLLKDKQESLTLVLSVGTLKGGVLFPTKASHEDATGSNENPSASQEGLLPEKAPDEGAAGGEEDMLASQESRQSMETWGVEKTAAWLCEIGLDKKYVAVCHKEDINGRALLLLACKSLDKLVSIFQLKKGPKTILMKSLEPHLKSFDHAKPQTACNSEHTFSEWTEKALCNWLRELRVPKECLTLAEEEELNGEMFLLLWKLGKLQKVLNLKEGSWVVLDHELFLHLGMIDNVNSGTNGGMPAGKTSQLMSKLERNIVESKEVNEFEEPLATNTSAAKTLFEASPKDTLSKDKEKLLLLQSALQLDIEVSQDSDKARECVLRSIFVRRDESANALEKLFNFIVVTEAEMIGDTPQKLWSKICEKMADWVTLLPEKDSLTLLWECGSETKTKVSLQDGKVGQIFLDRLCNEQYKQSLFVVLVDRQLLEENETVTYNFYLDEKRKHSYNLKLNVQESKYHASFDTNNPGLDLKLSKHFRSLMNVPRYQTPRPFASEFGNKYYNEGFVLDVLDNCETGSKDLMKPAREFKLLGRDVHNSEDDIIKKFFYETLRFACGCLNERTNGTIHFGVADEVEGQTCDYQPREIVGLCITDKPRYNDKLTEFINKCFVGDSRSNVHSCIQPPVFIPVKSVDAELPSDAKVVIEVDIEPRYSLCANEIFKAGFKCLDHGKEEPRAFIRHGSLTYAIDELSEIEDYVKNRLPKIDEERKNAEREEETVHSVPKHDSCKHLFDKLKRLLCANKKTLDSSIYPILVLSKPDTNMNQEFLNKTFHFIQNINWQVVIDFDDQGSESKGFFSVFKSGPKASQCDVHESEDYVDGTVGIGYKTHWIFANGYSKLNKKALGLKQWNRSKRKKGLSLVVQAIENTIPDMRAVVLFLLFSKDYEPIADIFLDCCMYLGGSNQLVYVAENSGMVKDWDAKLLNMCLEEHELRERGVVGMSWSEFQECLQQMVCGIDQRQLCVTMVTGSSHPLTFSFDNINVVSAKECEELRDLSHGECLQFSSKVEVDFYRGHPVTWANFWFTDAAHMNHVLRRNAYSKLKTLIEKLHSRSEGKVQTVTIHHHKGGGASTMARQALWDFRCNPHFPYRCAVVKTIDDETSKELLLLSKVGYSVNADVPFTPVLALVEDTDDFLFWELRSQVVEQANKLPRSRWPVCVFLYCKDAKKPYDCHLTEEETSVFLEQHLSKEEVAWFEDKYMKMKGNLYNKDPDLDFETYASENLTSFMIMKENFDPKYASSIVERNLNHVTDNELKLLKYTSLLQLYNPYPVFASWFDTIMLSLSLQRRKIFRDWIEDLTHSARIFLLEKDVSVHLGRGKVIAVVHPIIANALLDKIAGKKQTAVSQIAIDLLRSPLLGNKEKSFTSTYLYDGTSRMLKYQGKCEYDDNIQTKFSPLIEKILYVEDLKEQKRKPTEKSLQQATDVLREGLQKFKDPTITLQMVRVFNVNAAAFSKSTIDLCFDNALELCSMSIKMSPLNSFLCNAMGRIHESKIKILYGPVLEDNRVIEINDTTPVLSLAFEALKWFQKSQATADHQNNDGFLGELSVMFYLLGILRCVTIFRGREGLKKLQGYLAHCQAIPPEIKKPWNEFHEPIKDLRYRFSYCMEGLTEDFTIYKGNSPEERMLPNQIAFFKDQYHSYFGKGDLKWITESPEERWEFRWHKINQYLAGDIFSSVFSVHRSGFHKTPKEILQELKKLSYENYCEPVHKKHYNDLLLIVATTIALNSPYGKIPKHESTQLVEEYKELYSLVERLFTLEECDQGHKRLYAHLFKVMFLWPRKELELNSYRVQDFYDALKKLKNRWERKCKRLVDTHNMLKQKIYNNMTFKEQTRQYTTLFYLGKGSGLDVFVHINELIRRKGSVEWENPQTKKRLKRLTGVVESENIIRMQNPLESRRTVDVYYSSFCQGVFSKEEVSFYLGFSWAQPIAFDVKYTNTDHVKLSVECSDAASDFEERGVVSRHQDVTFGITKGKIIKKAGRNPVLKGDIR